MFLFSANLDNDDGKRRHVEQGGAYSENEKDCSEGLTLRVLHVFDGHKLTQDENDQSYWELSGNLSKFFNLADEDIASSQENCVSNAGKEVEYCLHVRIVYQGYRD